MRHVIVGDVHLVRDGQGAVASALAEVVRAHPGATLVFAGDLLDLAAESVHGDAVDAVGEVVAAHPVLRRALAEHVDRGGGVLLVAGNHDHDVATDAGRGAFAAALGVDAGAGARVRATPWFARLGPDGALHVEHGHQFDPDNSLPHPLATPDPAWSSLGIGLMREFIAPFGAHALVHANDRTPVGALVHAVELFGPRAAPVILGYFRAAAVQVRRAGRRYPADVARASGVAALPAYAAAWALGEDAVAELAARGATPTLASARATFLRLYWDRVLATAALSVAGASALLGGPGARVALGAAGVLVGSIAAGRNRYQGRVQASLRDNAEHIVAATGARAVVFAHIHDPVEHGAYMNTGSFAFPGRSPGRPYLVAEADGALRRAFFPRATAAAA